MPSLAGETAFDTLQGWFKELYADKEVKLVPSAAWMVKNIEFSKSEAGLGNLYHQPVVLTMEQGFTYAASAAGAFALNNAVAAVMKDAQIQGTQILLRSQIDYETLARAANTKASFGEASKLIVQNMMDAMSKRLELMFLYGRSPTGIGAVNAGTSAVTTFVISTASWAAGLWAGMEGAKLAIVGLTGTYPSQSQTRRTASGGNSITSIDFSTRTITCSATMTLTAGDIVFLFGTIADAAGPATISYQDALGIDGIVTQASGTLFNIDLTTYKIFQGNVAGASVASLTLTNVLSNLLPSIGKGLMEDVVLLCSNTAFQGLLSPTVDPVAGAAANKSGPYVNQDRKENMTYGARSVSLIGQQGNIEVTPHLFVKDKDIFIFPKKGMKRVGATDVTFNTPGAKGGEFFLHLPSNAGYELRAYTNQALFTPSPGKCTKMTLT